MESPRQKLILEEGGGAVCRNVAWGSDWQAAGPLLGHSSQRHRWGCGSLPQGQSHGRGLSGRGASAVRRPKHWALETCHGDEMGEETG